VRALKILLRALFFTAGGSDPAAALKLVPLFLPAGIICLKLKRILVINFDKFKIYGMEQLSG
jgi:hypothetical protein